MEILTRLFEIFVCSIVATIGVTYCFYYLYKLYAWYSKPSLTPEHFLEYLNKIRKLDMFEECVVVRKIVDKMERGELVSEIKKYKLNSKLVVELKNSSVTVYRHYFIVKK